MTRSNAATQEDELEDDEELESADEPEDSDDDAPDDESDPADEDEDSPAEAEDDETGDQAEDEDPAADAAPSKAPSKPAESEKLETRPFNFRVDGVDVDVPGAVETKFGIVVPRETWDRVVQPRLADRNQWKRERQTLQSQIDERDPERNETVIRAKVLTASFDPIIEALQKGDREKAVELFDSVAGNIDRLQLQAENELLKAQHGAHKKSTETQAQEAKRTEETQAINTNLPRVIDSVLKHADFAGLPFKRDALIASLRPLADKIFFYAVAGDGSGLAPGTLGMDTQFVYNYLKPHADTLRETTSKARKATRAANANARALGKSNNAPPPALKTKNSPAPGDKTKGAPKNKREWLKQLNAEAKLPE